MAEEQAVHVRGNSSEAGGNLPLLSLDLLPGVRVEPTRAAILSKNKLFYTLHFQQAVALYHTERKTGGDIFS